MRLTTRRAAPLLLLLAASLTTAGCAGAAPPAGTRPAVEVSTSPPAPSAEGTDLQAAVLAADAFPLEGWIETQTDTGHIPSAEARPCVLDLDALLREPADEPGQRAGRAWSPPAEPPGPGRVFVAVERSATAEARVTAARDAVAGCPLGRASQGELGMLTLTGTTVTVGGGRLGYCAAYDLEHAQSILGAMRGLRCDAAEGDLRVEVTSLIRREHAPTDAELQSVVDLAIATALGR